jgi:hypothetical protein
MHSLRQAARKHRLPSGDLADAYDVVRQQCRDERERAVLLRQAVWQHYAWTEGCLPFWRHGMQRRFPRAFGAGDRTLIPGFDVVAQVLAPEFPEFLGDNNAAAGDDPAARLFDFLAADYVPLPTAAELLQQAVALCRLARKRCKRSVVPF